MAKKDKENKEQPKALGTEHDELHDANADTKESENHSQDKVEEKAFDFMVDEEISDVDEEVSVTTSSGGEEVVIDADEAGVNNSPPDVEMIADMSEEDKTIEYQRLAAIGDMSDTEIRDILYPADTKIPASSALDSVEEQETPADKCDFEKCYDEAQTGTIKFMVQAIQEQLNIKLDKAKEMAYASREVDSFTSFMRSLDSEAADALYKYKG